MIRFDRLVVLLTLLGTEDSAREELHDAKACVIRIVRINGGRRHHHETKVLKKRVLAVTGSALGLIMHA